MSIFSKSMISYFSRESKASKSQGSLKKLKQLPKFTSPEKISRVDYSSHDIQRISTSISTLKNLHTIDLSHNRISKIESIFSLTKLHQLNLNHNLISEVPKAMLALTELEFIDLSYNKVVAVESLRPLKELFIIKGSLNVELEGNEVMKKLSNREKIKKWFEESINKNDSLNLTKQLKENHSKDYGDKTARHYAQNHNLIQLIETNTKEAVKKEQFSPNFKVHPLNQNSKLGQLSPQQKLIVSSTLDSDQLQRISHELTEKQTQLTLLSKNIQLFVKSHEVSVLPERVRDLINEQTALVEIMIQGHLKYTQSLLTEQLDSQVKQQYQEDIQLNSDMVKTLHLQIVQMMTEDSSICINSYKPWVTQYRKLKEIASRLPQIGKNLNRTQLRIKKIQEIVSVSPESNQDLSCKKEKELEMLLFSRQKESVSECDDCIIRKEEIKAMKQEQEMLYKANDKLSQERKTFQQQAKILQGNKEMFEAVIARQKNIIEELKQKIAPSTYQNILLEQAQGIENMLKYSQFKASGKQNSSLAKKTNYTQSNSLRQNRKSPKNVMQVSEFTIPEDQKPRNSKNPTLSSYFKNKPVLTTNSKGDSQEEPNRGSNSQRQSLGNSLQKRTDISRPEETLLMAGFSNSSKKGKEDKESSNINNQSGSQASKQHKTKYESSADSLRRIAEKVLYENQSKQELTKRMKVSVRSNSLTHTENQPNPQFVQNTYIGEFTVSNSHDLSHRNHSAKQLNYEPVEVHDGKGYRQYVRYHLRNNIISILNKKVSREMQDPSLLHRKYQKLLSGKEKLLTGHCRHKSQSSLKENRSYSKETQRQRESTNRMKGKDETWNLSTFK